MNLTVDEILKLMEKAKSLNIEWFRFGDLQFQWKPLPGGNLPDEVPPPKASLSMQAVPEKVAEDLVKPLSTLDQMTDQEILYYATPYYDELQAQKEAHAKKIAEENTNG